MNYSVVIVAAGKSTRFSAEKNKLLFELSDGQTVLQHTLKVFREDDDCKQIIVCVNDDTKTEAEKGQLPHEITTYGGASRGESVYNGLILASQEYVLVHDGARCYLSRRDLDSLKEALKENDGALLAKRIVDTIKTVKDGFVCDTIDRDSLAGAQTPQGFKTKLLLESYMKAKSDNYLATDDVGIMEKYSSVAIKVVYSVDNNEKVTTLKDIM